MIPKHTPTKSLTKALLVAAALILTLAIPATSAGQGPVEGAAGGCALQCIEKALGKKAIRNLLPMQPGDVEKTYGDVDALVADIGFQPKTPIEEGIRRFVVWYKEYYGVG